MSTVFLDRIDASPILSDTFEPAFATWLAVLVNVLNEDIQDIQGYFNLLQAQGYTAAEIASMFSDGGNVYVYYDGTDNAHSTGAIGYLEFHGSIDALATCQIPTPTLTPTITPVPTVTPGGYNYNQQARRRRFYNYIPTKPTEG